VIGQKVWRYNGTNRKMPLGNVGIGIRK